MADQKSRLEWPVNYWPNKFSLSFENDSEEAGNFPHRWPTHEQGYSGGWSHVNVLSMGFNRVSRFSAATGSHRPQCRFTKHPHNCNMRNKRREIALGLLFACMDRPFFLLGERFSTIKRPAVDADKPSVSGPPSNQTAQFQSAAISEPKMKLFIVLVALFVASSAAPVSLVADFSFLLATWNTSSFSLIS
jgi:hypothetical protein